MIYFLKHSLSNNKRIKLIFNLYYIGDKLFSLLSRLLVFKNGHLTISRNTYKIIKIGIDSQHTMVKQTE